MKVNISSDDEPPAFTNTQDSHDNGTMGDSHSDTDSNLDFDSVFDSDSNSSLSSSLSCCQFQKSLPCQSIELDNKGEMSMYLTSLILILSN